ncbi:protein MULTIPLE CHLOROPLAST DIVISION SITE 1 [Gastrolobium bilobum]|uniref:protein MULTIPLE CHLOROPLAST DIVISION SITE 1 n=1 Tax=Gastrolobium bilobum TaxID=150636 RepID=UPI002AB0ABA0|nr:protein MULTIPLE CHLOROPLAST DIVISION SITE 1 [Gastrolobium bilobum]
MASIWSLHFRALSVGSKHCPSISTATSTYRHRIRIRNGISKWCSVVATRTQQLKQDAFAKFHHQVAGSMPMLLNRNGGVNFPVWVCVAVVVLVAAVRVLSRKKKGRPGSVADLVRRGQLKSDRRGISRPLKYEDPFNNPLVKVGKGNSTVEMCGKVYRLAPVTLTQEQQAIHQKRRSRAYQWKRPTMFLKEGDLVPQDVDPDTIRWIPANHPFATTATDLDEDLAQNNVYQKHGVPFRIQAEHEALQKKLEALQNEQKPNKLVIDPNNAKDFERPFNSHARLNDHAEKSSVNNQVSDSPSPKLDSGPNHFERASSSEEDPSL